MLGFSLAHVPDKPLLSLKTAPVRAFSGPSTGICRREEQTKKKGLRGVKTSEREPSPSVEMVR